MIKTVRAVIRKGNKFLLVQRADSDEGGGYWQFVGGNTDNQNPKEALKREVKEESGLDVKSIKPLFTFKSPHHGNDTAYFLCTVSGNIKLQEEEIQAYKWVSKQEMKKLPLTKGAEIAIRRL